MQSNLQLIDDLMKFGGIQELNLNYNCLNDLSMGLFMNIKTLCKLNVRHNLFTQQSYSHAFPLLTKLKHLDLSENNLTDGFFRNISLLIIEN
jgi:Leucine-rich repeat (LRR) protein